MNDNQSDIPVPWHTQSVESVMQKLETSTEGLSDQEAEERLSYLGANELRKKQKKSIGKMLLEQIADVMSWTARNTSVWWTGTQTKTAGFPMIF